MFDGLDIDFLGGNHMVQLQGVLQLEFLHQDLDRILRGGNLPVLQATMQQTFSQLRFLQLLFFQETANLVTRLLGGHPIQPVGIG